ncbi:MAG: VOC family protein [Rubrobacteraceae bacterium]
MEARVHLITLGVEDLNRSLRFYRDGLGWKVSRASTDEIAFLRTGGAVIALFPRKELAADANVDPDGRGFRGITLARNVAERDDVERALEEAVSAGATLVKPAEDVYWGGRSGYFADPDGHFWEVAWNPSLPFAPDGSLELPD